MKKIILTSSIILFILVINIAGINIKNKPIKITISPEIYAARLGEWYYYEEGDCYKCFPESTGCTKEALPGNAYVCPF